MGVVLAIFEFLLWLQPAATPAASSGGSGAGGGTMGCGLNAAMMIGILAITYFFLLRPDAQRRKETEDMQKGLRVGDKVRTTGGILGEILRVNDKDVILGIAEKVRINVLKEHIKGPEVEAPPAKDESKTGAAAAASTDDKK